MQPEKDSSLSRMKPRSGKFLSCLTLLPGREKMIEQGLDSYRNSIALTPNPSPRALSIPQKGLKLLSVLDCPHPPTPLPLVGEGVRG
jgi:hypothetical protein